MRIVQMSRFGGPEVLEVIEVPTPQPGTGEVLVRVAAAGVNFFEALVRQDRYAVTPDLPLVPGVEVAGVVEACGPEVRHLQVGARVAVPLFAVGRGGGGYADQVCVEARCVVPIPDGLSFEDATALMVQGLTALHLIRECPPAGTSVLIAGAAGGVGTLLIQLAKAAGAIRVVATAGSADKLALARRLGADVGIEAGPGGIEGPVEPVDIIYDLVGGDFTRAALSALRRGGDLIFGALGRFALEPADMEVLVGRNQRLRGFALLPRLGPSTLTEDLPGLFDQAADGRLQVVQGGRYPLSAAGEAQQALESRRTTGKVVLVPWRSPEAEG